MPDVETLLSIGVRAYPKWYRDSNALNNGWNGRPAPADQVWRSSHTPSAQLPQASGAFHSVQDEERHRLASDSFRSTPAPAPTVRGSTYQRGRKAVTFPSFPNPAAAVPRFSSYHATAIEPRSRHTVASTFRSFPNKTIATRSSISAPLIPDPTPLTSLTNHNYDPVSPFNNLPSSSAPNHLSLLPFLASSPTLQAQAPCPEVKTPAPRHRRLFVPPGEPKYVSNTAPGTPKDGFRIKKDLKANKKNKGNLDEGLGLKKEIEELLVDFEG